MLQVCYLLNPPDEWEAFKKGPLPPQKLDIYGSPIYERYPWPGIGPRPLLDFPVLRNIDTVCGLPNMTNSC